MSEKEDVVFPFPCARCGGSVTRKAGVRGVGLAVGKQGLCRVCWREWEGSDRVDFAGFVASGERVVDSYVFRRERVVFPAGVCSVDGGRYATAMAVWGFGGLLESGLEAGVVEGRVWVSLLVAWPGRVPEREVLESDAVGRAWRESERRRIVRGVA